MIQSYLSFTSLRPSDGSRLAFIPLASSDLRADSIANAELFDYFNGAPEKEGDEHLGEDFAFCRRARAAGFDVLVDKNIPLTHHEGRMGLTTLGTRYG